VSLPACHPGLAWLLWVGAVELCGHAPWLPVSLLCCACLICLSPTPLIPACTCPAPSAGLPQERRRVCVPQAGEHGVCAAAGAELARQPGVQVRRPPGRQPGRQAFKLGRAAPAVPTRARPLLTALPLPACLPSPTFLCRSWQQACCVDDHGHQLPQDLYGAPLTFSRRQHDTMALGTIRLAYT
jgi:hypothetical protein